MKNRLFIASLFNILLLPQTHCMEDRETIITVVNQLTQKVESQARQLEQLTTNLTNHVAFTNSIVPIGAIMEYSGMAVVPNNWLECDGRAISRTGYAELLGVIRGTYGIGDGIDTFNIPDRRGRVAVGIDSNNSTNGLITNATTPNIALGQLFGEASHELTMQEIPDHTHAITHNDHAGVQGTAPFSQHYGGHLYMGRMGGNHPAVQDREQGTQSHNNMQPSIFMKFYIRAK